MTAEELMERQVIQSNPLVEARKKMNVTELRLFLLGVQALQPYIKDGIAHDVEFTEVVLPPHLLEQIYQHTGSVTNVKRQIRKAFASFIELNYANGGFELNHIYQVLRYVPQEGLHIKFDDMMRPYILDLFNKQYTSYKVKEIFALQSEYAWRIMELLQSQNGYLKQGKEKIYKKMSIQDLRFCLNAVDVYKGRMDNFRRFVLDQPIEEINEKTKYHVWYETSKQGRRIAEVTIFMELKNKEEEKNTDEQQEEQIIRNALKNETVKALAEAGVAVKTAKVLVDNDEARCIRNLKYAKNTKSDKIRNFGGYVVDCIENDYARGQNLFAEVSEEEKAARKEKEKQESAERVKRGIDMDYEVTLPIFREKKKELEERIKKIADDKKI